MEYIGYLLFSGQVDRLGKGLQVPYNTFFFIFMLVCTPPPIAPTKLEWVRCVVVGHVESGAPGFDHHPLAGPIFCLCGPNS